MKKKMNKWMINCMCLSFIGFSMISCNNDSKDPKKLAEEHNDAKFDDSKEKDAKFLVDAASINLEEIELSQLAETRAVGVKAKELAKMMLDDHKKSLEEVKTLAAKKMVTLPTSLTDESQNTYNKLVEKNGNDFDKKYCEIMTEGHKSAIKEFEKEANEATDMDIKNWASKTLPVLRNHLDHAMTCSEEYK